MWRRWCLLVLLLLAAGLAPLHADDAPPKLTRHVTDLTGTLSAQQVDQLDAQLVALEQRKGAQLVVLMVGSTQPQDIESYSLAVAEANKIGRKGSDDGLLLLIAKNDRRVRIEVGYGLEGAVPDAATARITREYIAPKFRNNDYYGGISDALGALTQLVDGEALPPPLEPAHRERRSGLGFQEMLFIGIFAGLFLRGIFGRARIWLRTPLGAGLIGGLLWLLAASVGAAALGAIIGGVMMLLPGGAGRSIGGGGWGGFGGWGGGGFGGGGFGGGGGGGGGFSGGGGSFGGGGSSGSW